MHPPTLITWILMVFGVITLLPLFISQLVILINPHGQKAKDILIGKGKEWRDKTHFKSAYGAAWADWLILLPLLTAGVTGILFSQLWGYALFAAAGIISVYINSILWFLEKEYVYNAYGPLAYYTYFWGNFMYWGTAAFVYGLLRLNGINF